MVKMMAKSACALAVGCLYAAIAFPASAQTDAFAHLRLIDRLDRPSDGYCLDILGVGRNLRVDVPIFAHNCKPALTRDSAVSFGEDGKIRFPAVELCATAAGVNGRALPGAAILLRPCGVNAPFFETSALQSFDFRPDGRLELSGSGLCLAAGEVSDRTYSPQDRWRVLSVEDCETAPAKLTRWEFNTGPFPGG